MELFCSGLVTALENLAVFSAVPLIVWRVTSRRECG